MVKRTEPEALPAYMVPARRDYEMGAHSRFALGVDLGQSVDPSALCLVERQVYATDQVDLIPGQREGASNPRRRHAIRYRLRGAELLPLGTPYVQVARHVATRFGQTVRLGHVEVLFDEGGSRGVGEMIRAHLPDAIGCVLTGGEDDSRLSMGRWSVSKANLVTGLLAGLESGDLGLAEDLPQYDQLRDHIVNLRRKISALGRATFNAAEGRHDDFVTAAGLAWWWSTRPRADWRQIKLQGW